MSPVRYELVVYIPEDGILHSRRRENLNSYVALIDMAMYRSSNLSGVRYELIVDIPEDDLLHSPRRDSLQTYNFRPVC
jgi:hypothetical protein